MEITLAEAMGLSQDRLDYENTIFKGCCWPQNTPWQTAGRKPHGFKTSYQSDEIKKNIEVK